MGYDIANYRTIHKPYGSLEEVDRLISGLHERRMKLVMDLVVNHTSDQVRTPSGIVAGMSSVACLVSNIL